MAKPVRIFTARTTNGQSTDKIVSNGRQMTAFVTGTFDSANVKVEFSPDLGTTWIDSGLAAITAAGVKNFLAPAGTHVRFAVTSVGASSSLDAWLGFAEV
jgi:hypothetical protein